MKRPFQDKRPLGPFAQRQPEKSDVEIKHGPIWTWVEVTTFQGSREESPRVTREHVNFVDNTVKHVMTSPEVKERLEFVGELNEFDIFCDSYNDMTISCFIRHSEDFMSIRFLDEVIDVLQAEIDPHKDLSLRDYRVVTEEFIEQKDSAIV